MNDLQRLYLLRDLIKQSQLSSARSLVAFASQIESLVSSIDDIPDTFRRVYSEFWEALEVLGVQHQESCTEPTVVELADLKAMSINFELEVSKSIVARED
jgi:hypothetical protein